MAYAASFTVNSLQRSVDCGALYLCGKCRMPIGDTNDWGGNHVGDNVVLMKAVSPCVKSGKVVTSSDGHDAGSRYKPLTCNSCNSALGKFYSSTPEHQSYKRNLYCIDNAAINRYTFGENLQKIIPASEAPITLERCHYFDEEFKKQKLLLAILQGRLSKLEECLASEQNS